MPCILGVVLGDFGARALAQWLKLPALKGEDHGYEPHSGIQASKKKTRNRQVACSASDHQGSNSTILGRFSWPSLAYVCTKVA